MLESEGNSGSTIFAGGLVENMGEVVGNGFFAQPQLHCHLAVGEASGKQAQHLYLTAVSPAG